MTECMRVNQRNRFVIITRFWWNFFPQRLLAVQHRSDKCSQVTIAWRAAQVYLVWT